MSIKKILMFVGIALVVFMLYKILFGVSKPAEFNPYQQQETPKAEEPEVQSAAVTSQIASKDQQLIDDFTKQINSAKSPDGNLYYQRGLVLLRNKQAQTAIQDFNTALRFFPNAEALYYNRALAYIQIGQYKKAVDDLSEAIKQKSDFADAYNARGLAYVELESYNEALNDYAQVIKLTPQSTEAYFNQGTLYMRMKQYNDAKVSFSNAISNSSAPANATPEQMSEMQTKLMQAYLNLARAELALGDFESALKDVTYVVTNDPRNIDALRLRADIYDKNGNPAAAANDTATADNLGLQKMLDAR